MASNMILSEKPLLAFGNACVIGNVNSSGYECGGTISQASLLQSPVGRWSVHGEGTDSPGFPNIMP